MTVAEMCMIAAIILPYVWVGVAKAGPKFDNAAPREQLANAEGYRQRANWAQQNAWEALAPFLAAVLFAEMRQAPQSTVDLLAGLFIGCRVLHGVVYIANQATLRSLIWAVGFFSMLAIFVTAARG